MERDMNLKWKKLTSDMWQAQDGNYQVRITATPFPLGGQMWHWHPYYAGADGKNLSLGGGGTSQGLADAKRMAVKDCERHVAKQRVAA
jgi:hypothetical protein